MTEQEYIEQRLEDQIAWYHAKSVANQRAYKVLRAAEIVAAALVPVLSSYSGRSSTARLMVALLGVTIAVIAGLLGLYQFQENWTRYRSTCEALKHEKFVFLTRTEPYALDGAFPLFVRHVESLVSKEHGRWVQYASGGANEKRSISMYPNATWGAASR